MCLANPLWGAPRIHGELLKLGLEVSETTVSKYVIRHRGPPSQGPCRYNPCQTGDPQITQSDHNWIEYWAVFTDAGGIIQSNGYYSEWTARQFKRVMEQKLKAAGIHDAMLWIKHGYYDGMADRNHHQNMNEWELPPA